MRAETSLALHGAVAVRLLAATFLGGLVGVEREATDQPAGLRTHIALGLGAALFGVISTLGFTEFDQRRATTVLQADVTRVASQVVVGVGFLGAGVIFRQRNTIRNLTTAASLWAVAAIGLACGVGDVGTAAIATAVLLVSLVILRPIRNLIRRYSASDVTELRVELGDTTRVGPLLEAVEERRGVEVKHVDIRREDERTVVCIGVRAADDTTRELTAAVAQMPEVEIVSHDA